MKKSISGVVTDTNDEPLIGATVLVKGTQNGTEQMWMDVSI